MNLVCPDCKKPVETIIACGCRDYFCNECNQMVSKKRVVDLDEVELSKQEQTQEKSETN
jgi:hypothetical protein